MDEILRGYAGLGSNLGDRLSQLQAAARRMMRAPGLALARASGIYESPAMGYPSPHMFYNAVVELTWQGGPLALAEALSAIEEQGGRFRDILGLPPPGEPKLYLDRTIDLDILWLAGIESEEPRLLLPHPRALERAFVLRPWAELAPDLQIRGASVDAWLHRLPLSELEATRRIIGPEWLPSPG